MPDFQFLRTSVDPSRKVLFQLLLRARGVQGDGAGEGRGGQRCEAWQAGHPDGPGLGGVIGGWLPYAPFCGPASTDAHALSIFFRKNFLFPLLTQRSVLDRIAIHRFYTSIENSWELERAIGRTAATRRPEQRRIPEIDSAKRPGSKGGFVLCVSLLREIKILGQKIVL